MKHLKLATKLVAGFGAILAIALLLGSMAVFNMNGVKGTAVQIQKEIVPEVAVANDVERSSLHTMYNMRGYAFTEEAQYLELARKNLEEVKKFLADAQKHAATSVRLSKLKETAQKAEASALEYERLANETVALTEALEKERKDAEAAAAKYMQACDDWLALQNKQLEAAVKSGAKADVMEHILKSLALANEVETLGHTIITGTWKSQFRRDPKLFEETEKKFEQVNAALAELKKMQPDAEEAKLIDACSAAGATYKGNMDQFLQKWLLREETAKKRGAAGEQVLELAKATAELGMDDTVTSTTKAASALATASNLLIAGLAAALLIGCAITFFLTRSITKPIRQVAGQLSEGAEMTVSAAGQVSSASQSLAEGASEQAASLEETSSSLEEMSSMTKRNTANAEKVNELARQTRAAADAGAGDMQAMAAAMNDIKASGDDIAKIIKTIDEISFQTNILALNAAVEAARAGEAGMGFAVVADEVRSLAQRCAHAARETSTQIEGAISKAGLGAQISGKVAATLAAIVRQARQVDELVAEVAGASREQSQGIEQVNMAVGQMDKVTQSNAATAEETASAAEELSAQAETMKAAVRELIALLGGSHESDDGFDLQSPKGPAPCKTLRLNHLVPAKDHSPARTSHRSTPFSSKRPATVIASNVPGRIIMPMEPSTGRSDDHAGMDEPSPAARHETLQIVTGSELGGDQTDEVR